MAASERKVFKLQNNFDVVMVRQHARELARDLGFGLTDQTRIATAVSEVARRALEYEGQMSFAVVGSGQRQGIECVCLGCKWPEAAPNRAPGELLGGLHGIERLMDEFELRPQDGERSAIVMRKWLRANPVQQSGP